MAIEHKNGITKITEDTEVRSDFSREANNLIRVLGEELQKTEPALRGMTYLGSATVHIYHSNTLGVSSFVCQVGTLGKTPEVLASQSFDKLQSEMKARYRGGKRD